MAAICRRRAGQLLCALMLCNGILLEDRAEAMYQVRVQIVFQEIRVPV